jgi:hypothetical protein
MPFHYRGSIPPCTFDNAVNSSLDPERSDSENAGAAYDKLSQFGVPSDRDQQNDLVRDIEDEVRRKRNSGF